MYTCVLYPHICTFNVQRVYNVHSTICVSRQRSNREARKSSRPFTQVVKGNLVLSEKKVRVKFRSRS